MRTEAEVFEFFDVIKPYLNKIMKDLDKDTAVQISLSPELGGCAVLFEVHKGNEYQHYVDISPDGTANNWHVRHPGLAS